MIIIWYNSFKDLSCLNRDLSRVIVIDWNDKSIQLQPENALKLKKWTGNDDDTTLVDLAMFLRSKLQHLCHSQFADVNRRVYLGESVIIFPLIAIVANEVEDVRTVLEFYRHFDDPLAAFKENQRRLQVIVI